MLMVTDTPVATCDLCEPSTYVPTDEIMEHVRLLHPDQYEEYETWPDGKFVMFEETTEPVPGR
jgi:hypothetical protein